MPDALEQVAQSHIRGNVPPSSDFDKLLRRDLTTYFKQSNGKAVTVDYQLLHREPTQSGVALPKYYLWVKTYQGGKLIEEGAARGAAIKQKQFEFISYFSKTDMVEHPQLIDRTFPIPIGDKIKNRIGRK